MAYDNLEKFNMLECYIESHKNIGDASELYFQRYPERRQPYFDIFTRLENNLINHGSFQKPRPKQYNKENNEVDEINTLGFVAINPHASSRQIRQNIGVNRKKIKKILKKHNFRQYRYRKVQLLHIGDAERRIHFCNWYLQKCAVDRNFFKKVIWTDEVHISSEGIFNRHNNLFWANENPNLTVDRMIQGKFGFNVWCALYNCRILCYTLFDGNLTSDGYLHILEENLVEEIANMNEVYFQQDGAPCHNARRVREFLNEHFRDNWLGTNGPVRWPPRSPDLTPLDFFFWGFIKNSIYKVKSNNVNELRRRFQNSLRKVTRLHLYNTIKAVEKRCRKCIENNGMQFEHMR